MPLAFRLTELMAERNITGYRLAKLLDVTPSAVYKLQRATRPSLDMIERLCDVLECTPADLLAYTPPKKKRAH